MNAKNPNPAQAKAATTEAPKARKATRVKPPEGETKNEAFRRMANVRVSKVLEALRVLENTFAPNNYEWTPEQAATVFAVIEGKIVELKERADGKVRGKVKFELV
jgi:hypothetical protein